MLLLDINTRKCKICTIHAFDCANNAQFTLIIKNKSFTQQCHTTAPCETTPMRLYGIVEYVPAM